METPRPSPFDDGELFDRMCATLDYGVDFYVEVAKEAGGPVLEVACGTGRVLLRCLEAGVDVEGLDLYPPMLETLRRKAQAKGLHPRLHVGDMREFALPRRYARILIPFNSFVHCLTAEEQVRSLRCCHAHLLPGGALVLDGFLPGPKYFAAANGTRVLEGEVPDPRTGRLLRMYDTRILDHEAQVQRSLMELEEIDEGGAVVAVHPMETLARWTMREEWDGLLGGSGFVRWELFGGFDRSEPREDEALVILAWKEETP
jgi:SAM-dependent methyltransferase